MDKIIEFVGNNYAWFLTVTIILLFALIGYIYDSKHSKSDVFTKDDEFTEENFEPIAETQEKSLSDMVSNSKNINPETKAVELVDETILTPTAEENEEVETLNNN